MPKDRFLSFKELSEVIGIKVGTIRNGQAGTAEIPRIKVGGRVMFSERSVEAWMARKLREAEERQAKQRQLLNDALAGKRRRQANMQRAALTIINGRKRA